MFALPFHLPFLVLPLGLLLVFCIAKGSCRRGGRPIGLFMVIGFIGVMILLARARSPRQQLVTNLYDSQQFALEKSTRRSSAPATQTAKPWIDDWTGFTNAAQFQGFRAESSDTCVTEAESLNEAMQAAARDLYTVVSARPELSSRRMLPNQSNQLMQQVTSAVVSQEVVAEQYVRTTEKTYGTLWKTYLLIDTSPAKINPIVRRVNQQISVSRRQKLTTAGSVAATVLVVLLLYAFLNTVTKGYFIWRLRAAVILVLIAGVLVVAATI